MFSNNRQWFSILSWRDRTKFVADRNVIKALASVAAMNDALKVQERSWRAVTCERES
jgi:hypothetical protein